MPLTVLATSPRAKVGRAITEKKIPFVVQFPDLGARTHRSKLHGGNIQLHTNGALTIGIFQT